MSYEQHIIYNEIRRGKCAIYTKEKVVGLIYYTKCTIKVEKEIFNIYNGNRDYYFKSKNTVGGFLGWKMEEKL